MTEENKRTVEIDSNEGLKLIGRFALLPKVQEKMKDVKTEITTYTGKKYKVTLADIDVNVEEIIGE